MPPLRVHCLVLDAEISFYNALPGKPEVQMPEIQGYPRSKSTDASRTGPVRSAKGRSFAARRSTIPATYFGAAANSILRPLIERHDTWRATSNDPRGVSPEFDSAAVYFVGTYRPASLSRSELLSTS
jgi:hypothetical protein